MHDLDRVSRSSPRTDIGRRVRAATRALGLEIQRLRVDVGLTQREVAGRAGIDHGFLARIETGERTPSLTSLTAIATALGGDMRVHIYPGTGPVIRDAVHASMSSALLSLLDPRWQRFVEVPVYRPVRGVIDLVLHDPVQHVIVGTEVESDLRRLEQEIRWAGQKAEALPSADLWRFSPEAGEASISRLLVLRSTRRTRDLAREYGPLLEAAYPAAASAVLASLRSGAPWPGAGIVWCRVERGTTTILEGPPRGVALGR